MSAFIVPDYHLDCLVSWAVAHRVEIFPRGATPLSVAQELYEENCRSVDYRYTEVNERSYRFTSRPEAARLSPVQVLKACDCLEYQSCEHPGWTDSRAVDILYRIRGTAIRLLPGYEQAAWTLNKAED